MKPLVKSSIILMAFSILIVSCQKETSNLTGDYSYNTSGNIDIYTESDTIYQMLHTERGSMRILPVTNDDGRVMIVKTSLSGKVTVLYATLDEMSLYLDPYSTKISYADINVNLKNPISVNSETEEVNVEGVATICDKNTILFKEKYKSNHIIGNDITTIAEKY